MKYMRHMKNLYANFLVLQRDDSALVGIIALCVLVIGGGLTTWFVVESLKSSYINLSVLLVASCGPLVVLLFIVRGYPSKRKEKREQRTISALKKGGIIK